MTLPAPTSTASAATSPRTAIRPVVDWMNRSTDTPPPSVCPAVALFVAVWGEVLAERDPPGSTPGPRVPYPVFGSVAAAATASSRDGHARERAWMALDWLVREHLPVWIERHAPLLDHAAALRDLEVLERTTLAPIEALRDVVDAARMLGRAARAVDPPPLLEPSAAAALACAGVLVADDAWKHEHPLLLDSEHARLAGALDHPDHLRLSALVALAGEAAHLVAALPVRSRDPRERETIEDALERGAVGLLWRMSRTGRVEPSM